MGGLKYPSQKFNTQMSSTNSGLLMLAVMAMVMPAALDASGSQRSGTAVLSLSRFSSLLMMCTYALLIFFEVFIRYTLITETNFTKEYDSIVRPPRLKRTGIWWTEMTTKKTKRRRKF
jgi:calcium/proton exchanger cax